jgi:hypothetical protein
VTRAPADREFALLPRNHIRDKIILASFREGLRDRVNPDTGLPFTEEEIERATAPGTRHYREADAIDVYGQGAQRQGIFYADQLRISTASTAWLEGFHARLWGSDKLPATPGSGTVTVRGTPGTVIAGSTTLPSLGAYSARAPNGRAFQVFQTVVIPSNGVATVTMIALQPGADTNPTAGTRLTWIDRDPGMEVESLVAADFGGGFDRETDASHARRIEDGIRDKEGAGNDAEFRAWARSSSVAIEDAYVYPCAMHAGTVLVAITQRRGDAVGPLGRLPSIGTMVSAIAYLTPPGSPVVPTPPLVIVVPWQPEPVDLSARLQLQRGTDGGWTDALPFPSYHATRPAISAVASQTSFTLHADGDATLPGQAALTTLSGANAPALMVWDAATSAFELLNVASVEDLGSNDYTVTLGAAPSTTLATGMLVSPATGRASVISDTTTAYFDERGPGELFAEADTRFARAARFPSQAEQAPSGVGAELGVRYLEALAIVGAIVSDFSETEAPYPVDITDGPYVLTLGKLGVYAL